MKKLSPRSALLIEAGAVIVGFTALTLAMTYPLLLHIGTVLPNDLGDPLLNTWILSWDADRLLHGLNGLWQSPLFFPYPNTLAYSEHLLGIAVIVAPVQWVWGNPVLTYNVAFLFSYILAGCGMYLLVKSLTGSTWGGVIAGVAFAFSPYRSAQLPHLQMLMSGWMPIGLWALHRYALNRGRSVLVVFVLAYLLQALSNGYSLYFFAVPVVVVSLDAILRADRARTRTAADLAAALSIVALGLMPVALIYYRVRNQMGFVRRAAEIQFFSADLTSYMQVTPSLRLWGGVLAQGKPEGELFTGATVLVLAAVALATSWTRRREVSPRAARAATLYAIVGLLALILSLGPQPNAWGTPLMNAGPYQWLLAVVPGLDGLRVPSRFGMVVFLSLSVLAGVAASWMASRCSRPLAAVIGVGLTLMILAEGYVGPLPYEELAQHVQADESAMYTWLQQQPPGAVIEFPLRTGDNATDSLFYMYRTLQHHHPIVNGFSGFSSPFYDLLDDGRVALFEPAQIPDTLRGLRSVGVRYLVLHPGSFGQAAHRAEILSAIEAESGQVAGMREAGRNLVIVLHPGNPAPRWNPKIVRKVPRSDIVASASDHEELLPQAFDGDVYTRWTSGHAQTGDEWLAFQFARPLSVARVSLALIPRYLGDYPRRLRVESSPDGMHFDTVLYDDSGIPVLLGGLARQGSPVLLDLDLVPNVSKALRVRQTGQSRVLYWSVHELTIWESGVR